MSVSIRHNHYYGNMIINQEKVVQGKAITGVTIPALLRSGEYCYKPFGGVIDDDSMMKQAQRVKLVNLTGFWWDGIEINEGYEIPMGHAVKGYLLNDRYYVAIKDDKPMHWQISR